MATFHTRCDTKPVVTQLSRPVALLSAGMACCKQTQQPQTCTVYPTLACNAEKTARWDSGLQTVCNCPAPPAYCPLLLRTAAAAAYCRCNIRTLTCPRLEAPGSPAQALLHHGTVTWAGTCHTYSVVPAPSLSSQCGFATSELGPMGFIPSKHGRMGAGFTASKHWHMGAGSIASEHGRMGALLGCHQSHCATQQCCATQRTSTATGSAIAARNLSNFVALCHTPVCAQLQH